MPEATRKILALLAIALCLLTLGARAVARDPDWQQTIQAGFTALADCRDDKALESFQNALEMAKAFGPTDPRMAMTIYGLGQFQAGQGHYADAEALYEQALTISFNAMKVRTIESTHPLPAAILDRLMVLYRADGRHAKADSWSNVAETLNLSRSIEAQDSADFDDPDTAAHIAWLYSASAMVSIDRGDYAEAESSLARALLISEKARGLEHPDTAWILIGMADLNRHQRHYDAAESLAERASEIFNDRYGPEHQGASASLKILADVYHDQGRDAEARALDERLLLIWEKEYENSFAVFANSANPPRDPYSAPVLKWYPELLRRNGRAAEADAAEARARSIWTEAAKKQRAELQTRCASKPQ